MVPEQLDRAIAVAAARYRAMTPADFRRERRADARRHPYAALRALLGRVLGL